MSSNLVQVVVALAQGPSQNTPSGAAYAGTSVVVTDSTGVAQSPVTLTGKENPPFQFTTSVAVGSGTVVATDLDVNGVSLGSASTTFTEQGSPPTFNPTASISVTPVSNTAAVAALAARAKR